MPPKPDAVNPAMTIQLAIVSQERGITDLERWAICTNYDC